MRCWTDGSSPAAIWYKKISLKGFRFRISFAEGFHRDREDPLGSQRFVAVIAGRVGDFVHHFHTFRQFSKSGVRSVQVRSSLMHDEKLGTGGVRVHGSGHREYAGSVSQRVGKTVLGKFSSREWSSRDRPYRCRPGSRPGS